jgi:hypothetical protein
MSEFNKENMGVMCDYIIRALQVCVANKETWKTDKYGMLRLIQADNELFYETYPRICRILIFEDDISPLLAMIKTFTRVQSGEISFEQANKNMTDAINAKYIDHVLNSDKLKAERDHKKKQKIQVVS